MKIPTFLAGAAWLFLAGVAGAQEDTVALPPITVYSTTVANQSPAGAFPMPVSALRYEPLVDLESRNMAESQGDVTIQGDIFENTGLEIGALSLFDPQTGHYLEELPVAPAMLTPPDVVTGAGHALTSMNSTVGALDYGWRPIRNGGMASAAAGNGGLNTEEVYQGFASSPTAAAGGLAADVDWDHSEATGLIPWGDHDFNRVDGRLQLSGTGSQTDLFAGYQKKFFGWPNLYTPFDSDESENLETVLLDINHRVDLGGGDFLEAGGFWRRNKDDYAFDRFAPLGTSHPYQHTTWLEGAAFGGRQDMGWFTLNYHAEATTDFLKSTSLIYGKFHTRELGKVALIPEKSWAATGGAITLKAGATLDGSNREGTATSPVVELARTWNSSGLQRLFASYAETTEVPSYTALNSSATAGLFLGNPNLPREYSRNAEVGASGAAGGWTGQVDLFYRDDTDLVDWTYTQGVFGRQANPVDLKTTGGEAVVRRTWNDCTVVLGFTAMTKSFQYLGPYEQASFYALNYARDRLTAAFIVKLTGSLELRWDNELREQEPDILRTAGGNGAYHTSVGLVFRPGGWRGLELNAQVDNLTNSAYQTIPAVPASPRQYSFGIAKAW
jgi:outer membrane receptor protein involved in Fe transport